MDTASLDVCVSFKINKSCRQETGKGEDSHNTKREGKDCICSREESIHVGKVSGFQQNISALTKKEIRSELNVSYL